MSAGAPVDFGGVVLPNPSNIKPMADTDQPPASATPLTGGAKMSNGVYYGGSKMDATNPAKAQIIPGMMRTAGAKGDPYAEFGGQSQETQRSNDPYAEFGGQTQQTQQPPQQGALSRFIEGAKNGMGADNALSPRYRDPANQRPIADNPLIPGTGVYRDIKAGNYAGAAGRVVAPVAALGLALAGGRNAKPDPAAKSGEALASIPAPKSAAEPAAQTSQPVQVGKLPAESGDPYAGPRTPDMKMVDSTNLQKAGYDAKSQTMVVEFRNGRVYEYRGVPKEIYQQFNESESQGSFLSRNIKGRYQTNYRGSVLGRKY